VEDIAYLAAAYTVMIGLIGWFTWQLMDRLNDVNARMDAVESSLSNPTDSEE
tara:strand:- start:1302 stop:1457 length:156 start_codon:yes stop_codon:yes gene_type:complete